MIYLPNAANNTLAVSDAGNQQAGIIPFNKPFVGDKEMAYLAEAVSDGNLAGIGRFTRGCENWLQTQTGSSAALLTHSCTAALEMAALLLDIQPGDEVIMPSFTFASTANAFALRGGVPVFIDIRSDTLNLDEELIEAAIGPRTRAIVPVHYAGVACEMDAVMAIADRHGLAVIEDAAQAVGSFYKGQPVGAIGDMGAYSFHETKNITSGKGGCLLVKSQEMVERSEIIRENGTDRRRFEQNLVQYYQWQSVGSSYCAGEMTAAILWAQLEQIEFISRTRHATWQMYHEMFSSLEARGVLRRPVVPNDCTHNAHMYYVLLDPSIDRDQVLRRLRAAGIYAAFHYVPLHFSPAGRGYGQVEAKLDITTDVAARLIRFPMWVGLSAKDQERVVAVLSTGLQ